MSAEIKSLPKIGVVAISKNEERDIRGFLDNLISWVDEIVIVDDGSTDSTKDIIKSAGDKVILVEKTMDKETGFSGQRNAGIDVATSDWLLHMDIDERVTPELAYEIREVLNHTDNNGFRYRRLNYFLHRPMRGGGWQNWNKPQLAKRDYHRFERPIHEECVITGGENKIGQLRNEMLHFTDESFIERMEKSFSYCQGVARLIQEKNRKVRWYDLLLRPVRIFIKKYILQGGYRDKIPGFISAVNSAGAEFRSNSIVWDRQNKIERDLLERDVSERWKHYNRNE